MLQAQDVRDSWMFAGGAKGLHLQNETNVYIPSFPTITPINIPY